FGYVAERNKKYVVKTVDELEKGFDNAVSGYPFWIDPFCKDRGASATSSSATSSAISVEKKATIADIMTSLQEKHGLNSYPDYKYRIWAEMVMLGSGDMDTVPDVPMFNRPAKRPRSSTTTATTSAVGEEPAAPTIQPTEADATTKRSEVLKQLRDLFELLQMDAISEAEYMEKKKMFLDLLQI
ncbi:Hypothetical predicted protein, partial [Paramuricea clavata]